MTWRHTSIRNTPTGVGKTVPPLRVVRHRQKHPHGRGEDCKQSVLQAPGRETPPRAWGRRICCRRAVIALGNTPTGVGKTLSRIAKMIKTEKHPHGRGEDILRTSSTASSPETPPRAWGRRHRLFTSEDLIQKHPHGRGEDLKCIISHLCVVETPPRAWGRLTSSRN